MQICRSVCDGGQLVWANSNVPEGLAAKSGVLLHTAVGMPICFAGDALCVIVLFATQPIPMTPGAIEFLCSTARAASATQSTSGFVKSECSPIVSPTSARANEFKNVWDVSERLSYTHSTSVHFHLLPVDRLQAFSDYQEVTSLHDIPNQDTIDYTHSSGSHQHHIHCSDHSHGTFSGLDIGTDVLPLTDCGPISGIPENNEITELQWIQNNFNSPSPFLMSTDYPATDLLNDFYLFNTSTPNGIATSQSFDTDLDYTSSMITKQLSTSTDPTRTTGTTGTTGCTVLSDACCCSKSGIIQIEDDNEDDDEEMLDVSSFEFVFEDVSKTAPCPICLPFSMSLRPLITDARASFRASQSRFLELMDAMLCLTLFECAELWLLSEKSPELYIVTSLHQDEAMQPWSANAQGMRLKRGVDVPGVVFETCIPHWDKQYNTRHVRCCTTKKKNDNNSNTNTTCSSGSVSPDLTDEKGFDMNPRSNLAFLMGMQTAFGVPLPGPSGTISGVLALYSRISVEPDALLLTLVHKSVQHMSVCVASSICSTSCGIHNTTQTPSHSHDHDHTCNMSKCNRETICDAHEDISVKSIASPSINLPETLFCVVHPGRSKRCKSEGCNRCSQVSESQHTRE